MLKINSQLTKDEFINIFVWEKLEYTKFFGEFKDCYIPNVETCDTHYQAISCFLATTGSSRPAWFNRDDLPKELYEEWFKKYNKQKQMLIEYSGDKG